MMRKIFFQIIAFTFMSQLIAQESLKTLNIGQLHSIIREFHPIVKQSEIRITKAMAEHLLAKSNFDPILSNAMSEKVFGGNEYYSFLAPEIKIPTWFGIELSAGLQELSGEKLDASEAQGRSNYIGFSIPLAKNLIMDKRRATLKQAKIYTTMADVEKKFIVNDLMMQSVEAYYNWVKSYKVYQIIIDNAENSKKRIDFIRASVDNGERPAVDTLEVVVQYQMIELLLNTKLIEYQNAVFQLSSFLWVDEDSFIFLPNDVVPEENWEDSFESVTDSIDIQKVIETARVNHPALELNALKNDILTIEQKLKFQELLPKIDLKYNQLGKGYDMLKTVQTHSVLQDNFQYGVKFEMPLFLAKGRAEYKISKLKIEENSLDKVQKQAGIELKLLSYFNEYENLRKQVVLQSSIYKSYQTLLSAEVLRFENGESSIFLVNSRESKILDGAEKLINLKAKYFKTAFTLKWGAGTLQ